MDPSGCLSEDEARAHLLSKFFFFSFADLMVSIVRGLRRLRQDGPKNHCLGVFFFSFLFGKFGIEYFW